MTGKDRVLLAKYAINVDDDKWILGITRRTAQETLDLIKACLYLGYEPTDILTSKAWVTLVNKVKALEEKTSNDG